jgi:hypothetical protein
MSKFAETRDGSSTAALSEKAQARFVAFARKADNCQLRLQLRPGSATFYGNRRQRIRRTILQHTVERIPKVNEGYSLVCRRRF